MDLELLKSVRNFIRKNPKYKTGGAVLSYLGQAWFDKIFEDDDTTIILRNNRKCPLVNPYPEYFEDDKCIKVPDYTNIVDTYTITIIYKKQPIYQDFISEYMYKELIKLGTNNFSLETSTISEFIQEYSKLK